MYNTCILLSTYHTYVDDCHGVILTNVWKLTTISDRTRPEPQFLFAVAVVYEDVNAALCTYVYNM